MWEARMVKYRQALDLLIAIDKQAGAICRQERMEIIKELKLDKPLELLLRLPSKDWLTKMILSYVHRGFKFKEAGIDAGAHGIIRLV